MIGAFCLQYESFGTNDFEYVGQTTRTVEEHFREHARCKLFPIQVLPLDVSIVEEHFREHARCKTSYLNKAIQSHGKDMLVTVMLKICSNQDELNFWKKHFICSRDTMTPNGYPKEVVKATAYNKKRYEKYPVTAQTSAKQSTKRTGFRHTEETKLKMSTDRRMESPYKIL